MKLQIRYVVILGLVLMMTTWLSAQNKVGIGTVAPDHRLHISGTDSLILKLENLTPLNTNVRANLLFKTGNRFTGAIKTIGTSGVDARLGLFTFASLDATFLKERMSILDNGMVGIDNTAPFAPLSFANYSGNKIDLSYNSSVSRYGIGIQASLLQLYTNGASSDIAFGYGSSAAFTELMRIKGNGNVGIGTSSPEYLLDIDGRARLRHAGGLTAGVWYNKTDNTASTFAGMQSDTSWGLYSSGYKFIFDMDNGRLGIGGVTAQYPLAFPPAIGDKISLFGGGGLPNADHYGFGIQASIMQLFTPASNTDIVFGYGRSAAFTENMRIKGNGYVGIGTLAPIYRLDIKNSNGALLRLENSTPLSANVTAEFYFKTGTHYSGAIKTIGTTSNVARMGLFTFAGPNTTDLIERISIADNGNVGIGTTSPGSLLSFANLTGDKINFYNVSPTSKYGIGLQGALLQFYTHDAVSDIAFGYGSSSAFTEKMRIKGNGNVGIGNDPVFPLDISGRVRIRHVGVNTPGIWFNKPDNTQGSFIGQFDATNFGIWGPGSAGSWKFLFDGSDGTLRIGTLEKALGYLVNIGGKLIAEEVRVQLEGLWPDYVFHSSYQLTPINELKNFIQTNQHLPGFEKATVYETEGVDLGETQRKLVEKVEELSLYIIQLHEANAQLKSELQEMKSFLQMKNDD